MKKSRSRRSTKVAAMKSDNKETDEPVPKEKKRRCPPRVELTSIEWSDKVTHPAVWTVLTVILTGLLIYLMVLVCPIDWTVAQGVEEQVTTTTAATISTAFVTTFEKTSTVDGSYKPLDSTISPKKKKGATQHLPAKQDSCESCSSQLSQSAMSSSMSSICGDNHRCSVDGQCIDAVDGVDAYTCICDVGYYGRYCDVALSDCERLLCNSYGECRKGVDTKQIYCSCTDGYTGDNCEVESVEISTPCTNLTTPCSGNGQCIGLSKEDYICTCSDGYNGTDCDVDINECDSNPCYHGNCTDLVNGFSCDCELGYEGVQCHTDIDDCTASPCPTHSTCVDLVNNYTCLCDVGYTGVDCHSLCDDEPCFNNATCSQCVEGSCNGTGLAFRCNCTDNGTYGVLCTDRDGYWSEWSNWVRTPDWSIEILETPSFSAPLANCTYLNSTRTRMCVQQAAHGKTCEGLSFEEAALTDPDVECECLLCCENNLPCEPFWKKSCFCNEGCGSAFTLRCCNNRDLICSTTTTITESDLV